MSHPHPDRQRPDFDSDFDEDDRARFRRVYLWTLGVGAVVLGCLIVVSKFLG